MADKQDPCLTILEILAYLDGQLPEGRRVEVDQHLEECRLCGAAVEGVAGLEWREGFVRSADSVRARVRARTAAAAVSAARPRVPRFRPIPQYLTLAATLVLGAGVAVYVTRPGPDEGLFQRYFEPYPSTRPVVRGTPPGATATTDAMALYEARDYRGALAAFEVRLEGESPDSHDLFYAGLSRLALGEAEEATLALEKVLRLGPSELKAPAEWYLALVHLRAHHLGETRSRLEHIVQTGGFYQDKARGLLSALNRLEPGK